MSGVLPNELAKRALILGRKGIVEGHKDRLRVEVQNRGQGVHRLRMTRDTGPGIHVYQIMSHVCRLSDLGKSRTFWSCRSGSCSKKEQVCGAGGSATATLCTVPSSASSLPGVPSPPVRTSQDFLRLQETTYDFVEKPAPRPARTS